MAVLSIILCVMATSQVHLGLLDSLWLGVKPVSFSLWHHVQITNSEPVPHCDFSILRRVWAFHFSSLAGCAWNLPPCELALVCVWLGSAAVCLSSTFESFDLVGKWKLRVLL